MTKNDTDTSLGLIAFGFVAIVGYFVWTITVHLSETVWFALHDYGLEYSHKAWMTVTYAYLIIKFLGAFLGALGND